MFSVFPDEISSIQGERQNTRTKAVRPVLQPFVPATAWRNEMAYTITDARAIVLKRIANAVVGPQVKNGFIKEREKTDYVQELLLIMVNHQEDWTIPEKVCFETFATMVMKKRFISLWRTFHSEKDVLLNATSLNLIQKDEDGEDEELLDEVAEDGSIDNPSVVFKMERKRQLQLDVADFLKTLSEDDRKLCELLMEHGLRGTAAILGKHKYIISRRITRIRKLMLEAGFQVYL